MNAYEIQTLEGQSWDWSNRTDKDVLNNYANVPVKLITGQQKTVGRCHNYALKLYKGQKLFWDCDEAYEYLKQHYKIIPIEQLQYGDIVTYHEIQEDLDNEGNEYEYEDIEHFAKVIKTDGTLEGTVIRSKWGTFGVFETGLSDVPYNGKIMFWHKE